MVEAVRMAGGPRVREWARKNRFSEWMVARFAKVAEASGFTPGERLRFLDGLRHAPPSYVRANRLRANPEELARRLVARGFRIQQSTFDASAFRIHEAPISVGATLEHLLGWSSPQDLASGAAPMALNAQPGQTIVDLAAAPGMKTIQMAGHMDDSGALVAIEPDATRARALRANLERAGVSCSVVREERAQDVPGEAWADGIMVDAPCTGEGTIPKDRHRRHGEIGEIATLSALQEEILDSADRLLKPGGTMIYATCTFAPEENEVQVARMLEKGYTMERLPFDDCEGAPLGRGITEWPGFEIPDEVEMARRFFPGLHPTLGFFVARLRKEDN